MNLAFQDLLQGFFGKNIEIAKVLTFTTIFKTPFKIII